MEKRIERPVSDEARIELDSIGSDLDALFMDVAHELVKMNQPVVEAPVVPNDFVWPKPPPSKGQSHVLFEDGYAEGWAKAIDTVQKMLRQKGLMR